ncbi:MAG TPA: hypothetical protein VF719_06275 [Abditibacteriaceae bacterium]
MKKLPEDEKLQRGLQILLTAQDKAALEAMARESGMSLSAAARPHVLRAIDRWRAKNPDVKIEPSPPKPSLMVGGKIVRSIRPATPAPEARPEPATRARKNTRAKQNA